MKKGWTLTARDNVDGPGGNYTLSEISPTEKDKYQRSRLYVESKE